MLYTAMKHTHMLLLVISVLLFVTRYILMMIDSPMLQKKGLKVLPHIIDTLLLASGITLVFITGFIPLTPAGGWLNEKIIFILIYIGLGFIALKLGKTKLIRTIAFIGALGALYWISRLAMTKIPALSLWLG